MEQKTDIYFNGTKIEEEKRKKHILSIIKKNAQEVVYYEDFMFDIPQYIIYPKNKKKKISDDKLLQLKHPSNKFWQEVLDNIIKGTYNDDTMSFEDDVVYYDYEKNNMSSALQKMG